MKREMRDNLFLAECILAGGAIRELAEEAIDAGWTARKFRSFVEFMSQRGNPES